MTLVETHGTDPKRTTGCPPNADLNTPGVVCVNGVFMTVDEATAQHLQDAQ
jgi:hypothetical protein